LSLIDIEINGAERAVCRGMVRLDDEWILRSYDEEAEDFIGEYEHGIFKNIAYDDRAKEEIENFLAELKKNGTARTVTMIKNADDKPRLVDMSGTTNIQENSYYDVVIWDITNVESSFTYYYEKSWKYAMLLGLGSATYFDLNLDTKEIVFYRYVGKKPTEVYRNDYESFKKDIVEYAEQSEANLGAIEALCQQMEDGFAAIEAIVRTAFLHKDKKIQRLNVQARFDGASNNRTVSGSVVATDDSLEDVPYYMTYAGLDPMTGLLNKRSIVEYTENMIANPSEEKRKHYLILLDIDDFKSINDNYGHQEGDKAIQLVANELKNQVKDQGIIGRFGGDEFYIFTDGIDSEEKLRSMLRNIRNNLERDAREKIGMQKLTVTMGVALYPDYGHSYKELFALADKCLYIAKEKGKNRYSIYRPDLHQNVQVGAERKGMSSYDEQAKAINQVVRQLFLEGRNAIGDSLNAIVKGFDLDNIDIFFGKDLISLYNCGKYSSDIKAKDFVSNSRYMELFDSSGTYVMNSYSNLKKPLPEIYDMLQEKNCMSLIQMALPNPDIPEFFISFNMLNRIHRWSEAEISNLTLFGTLVYEAIRGRR